MILSATMRFGWSHIDEFVQSLKYEFDYLQKEEDTTSEWNLLTFRGLQGTLRSPRWTGLTEYLG